MFSGQANIFKVYFLLLQLGSKEEISIPSKKGL